MRLDEYVQRQSEAAAQQATAKAAMEALGVETPGDAQAVRAAVEAAVPHIADDDTRLRVRRFYPPWTAGEHAKGDIYTADDQVWECIQGYDNAAYPDIVPGAAAWRTFHRPLHGTGPDTAMPWVQPTGAHDMYKAGEYMTLLDALWRCIEDTAYSPTEYAAAWEVVE